MKLFRLTAPCKLFSRQRCRLPSKYMDMLTKSGINNGYNQRSAVWDSKTPFCRYTMYFPLQRALKQHKGTIHTNHYQLRTRISLYSNTDSLIRFFVALLHSLLLPPLVPSTPQFACCWTAKGSLISTASGQHQLSAINSVKFLLKSMKWLDRNVSNV